MKTKPGPQAPTTDESVYRNNPEIDAKIDRYIKDHPKFWEHIQGMPRDRLERSLVLTEVRADERREKANEGVLKRLNEKPELKKALELAVKDVPEDRRDEALVRMARQAQRVTTPRRGEGQGVAV